MAVDAGMEESPSVTPVESVLQGTVAPPSTPHATRELAPSSSYSGMIGDSIQAIHMQSTGEPISAGEVYPERDINVAFEAATDFGKDVIAHDMTLEPEAAVDPELTSPTSAVFSDIANSSVGESDLFDEASHVSDDEGAQILKPFELMEEHDVSKIAVIAIPTVIAAKSISALATEKPEQFDSSHDYAIGTSESTPFKDTSVSPISSTLKPPTIEVHGPFIDPLKYNVQPHEISSFTSSAPRSSTLAPPKMSIPSGPLHITPSKDAHRPSTSYSWLGALFGPINPTIVEAQRTGWVEISTEIINEPPVRKNSGRLRKKIKDIMMSDHVNIPYASISNRQDKKNTKLRGCVIM